MGQFAFIGAVMDRRLVARRSRKTVYKRATVGHGSIDGPSLRVSFVPLKVVLSGFWSQCVYALWPSLNAIHQAVSG